MDTSLLLAEKVAASTAIGLLIGLEREWAHKEAGVRSFTIATLLGTLAWIVSPALAFVEVSVVLVVIILVNVYSLTQDQPLQITTSLALAATNVLGILVGADFLSSPLSGHWSAPPPRLFSLETMPVCTSWLLMLWPQSSSLQH